jgi:hypothetical protein
MIPHGLNTPRLSVTGSTDAMSPDNSSSAGQVGPSGSEVDLAVPVHEPVNHADDELIEAHPAGLGAHHA